MLEGDVFRVIAEATAQSSAADHKSADPFGLTGTVTLGLGGSRRQAQDVSFHHEECIIRDSREKTTALEENAILERSQARFYAEVPLNDSSGKLIGTYGVMDKDPRTSFSDQELANLYDHAKSIAAHLDAVVAQRRDRQSKLQLKALIAMSKGHDAPQTTDWKPPQSTSKSGFVSPHSSPPDLQRPSHPPTAAQPTASSQSGSAGASALQNPPSKGRDHESYQRQARKSSGRLRNSRVAVPEARSIPPDVTSVYAKAASLLQVGMDLDGVMFVDAPRVSSRLSSRRYVTYLQVLNRA
jgi:ribosomal protein S15P/S13E